MPNSGPWAGAGPVRQRGELAFALVFLLCALLLLSQIGTQALWFPRTQFAAQPAFWPMVSLIGMSLFGGLYLISLLRMAKPVTEWREMLMWAQASEYVGWYLAYAAIVPVIGYLPATLLVMPLLVWRLGLRSRAMMWASVAFAFGVVIFFKTLLSVRIPGGKLYDLLPPALRSFMVTNF